MSRDNRRVLTVDAGHRDRSGDRRRDDLADHEALRVRTEALFVVVVRVGRERRGGVGGRTGGRTRRRQRRVESGRGEGLPSACERDPAAGHALADATSEDADSRREERQFDYAKSARSHCGSDDARVSRALTSSS